MQINEDDANQDLAENELNEDVVEQNTSDDDTSSDDAGNQSDLEQDAGDTSDLEQDGAQENGSEGQSQKQIAQTRIDQLTAQKNHYKKQRDELKKRLAAMEQAPEPDPYEADDDYFWDEAENPAETKDDIAAVVRQALEQQRRQELAYEEQRIAQHEQAVSNDMFMERLNQFKQTRDDAEVALSVNFGQNSDVLFNRIKQSEVGPQLAYKIAKDPAALEALKNAPIEDAIFELGKIEASVKAAPSRKSTSAPPPVDSISGASNNTSVPLGDMDYREYRKARGLD